MNKAQRQQRAVLVGELSPLPASTWVPEVLRNFGTHTMTRAELEVARRAFVCEALDRKFARGDQDCQNTQYASPAEFLTPIIEVLAELPRRSDCPESELQNLIDAQASHILGAAGTSLERDASGRCRPMERPAEAIATLEKLRKAAQQLGPLAEQTLHLTSELLKLDTYVEGASSLIPHPYLLIDKIDSAIAALRPGVNKGQREPGGNRPRGARLADQVARAYAEIAGELPPTTDPSVEHARERPYHQLVRRIFQHYHQKNWRECAKQAADHLHQIGRRRRLRTARPGRPPRSTSHTKGGLSRG